ncbi:Protein geranylgeranyltransferase Type I, beta subunit [Phaffia rhodozyma]|uniref:Protein geranylgeranyltransferase Type I, beta subunit n=1 Tax=Phaffia rhodozyma TaxID=264483 RepID=A0A0F7SHV7_PHARH|nr:Protein geranylgeranyltransferase Type I, beta subunit [Phaffia rhodozyma]
MTPIDLLGTLFEATDQTERNGWIQWVWDQQLPQGGFRGSPFTGPWKECGGTDDDGQPITLTPTLSSNQAHLASTYTALLVLSILRAPLDKLNRPGLVAFLRSCQFEDGSFSPLRKEMNAERDVRMVLCACVISDLVADWTGVNVEQSERFVQACCSYDGGFGQRPQQESQGGTTYCALASLHLLSSVSPTISAPSLSTQPTISWLLHRQIQPRDVPFQADFDEEDQSGPKTRSISGGFQGRPGKLGDCCYSFWCGGGLSILGAQSLIDGPANKAFLLRCQSIVGGFGKAPLERPDPFHTYSALAALSLFASIDDKELGKMDALRNMSKSALGWLESERTRLGWLNSI